ncbi:lasso peptide biosynthesis B2 protein [Deinococcus altitudinis]|uniref:lasso peptide biosynthesis B2 protein n=1 Tax=Deinococcus altitudinis TaxID=468914 RepID=UPI003892A85B
MSSVSSRLADLLTVQSPDVQPADLAALQSSGMAAWVASRLPADHAMRGALEPARLTLLVRQMLLRRSMLALLRAWNEAGVESMLLKGFMLAEFAYRTPGTRPYGDVDILVRPEQLDLLLEVARTLGWKDDGTASRPAEWQHEIAHLYSPDGQVRLDVHRFAVPWIAGPQGQVRRLTQALWKAAEAELLEGVTVYRPSWADCALNLVLGRSWTGDRGEYKPADYTDLESLAGCPGVTPESLETRARELGALHTWRAFLAGCDPWRAHFELGSAARSAQIRQGAHRDGAVWPLGLRLKQVSKMPAAVWCMGRMLPDVLSVRRSLKAVGRDPRQLVRQVGEVPVTKSSSASGAQVTAVIKGVAWLTRLIYPNSPGSCVPRSLATYRALHRIGFPAVYVSGVRRGANGVIEGHAWVEGPEGVIDEYGEPMNRYLFQIVFEER